MEQPLSYQLPPHIERVVEVWKRFEAALAEHRPRILTAESPAFHDYAWNSFMPDVVLSILADNAPSYFAHREMLFAGICTWVVAPDEVALIRQSMLLTAIEHMCRAE